MTAGTQEACVWPVQVLGLGNTLLGDDGVGWEVATLLEKQVDTRRVCITWGGTGGDALLDLLLPCRCLVVVDALNSGAAPGSVHRLGLNEVQRMPTPRLQASHGLDLGLVLQLHTTLYEADWPEAIRVFAIEVQEMTRFCEGCSVAVQAGARQAVREIQAYIAPWL